ncbi:trypco2 family protein [Nocardia crassostreae]|uniref:trypco2 family protein n=1 Tax=Nocardia crassostreae TaxID=53428 RepID=UPI00082B7E90|nr:trypco2 family protein [Nocardia crassostreae]
MIELSAFIQDLREELSQAIATGAGHDLRFELGPIELEASVAVTREAGAGAKVRFWVVDADAQGKLADARTQTVRLTLSPVLNSTGRSPYVSGDEAPGER